MNSAVLKSKISTSVQVFKLPDHAALLFTWCLAHTDDYGRVPACADWWALRIAPGRTDPARATEAIEQIVGAGLLTRYCCGGSDYLFVPNWFRHQGFNDTYTLKALYPHPTTGVVEAPIKWPDFRRAYPTEESRMYYNGSTAVVQREYRTEDNTPSPSPSPSPSPNNTSRRPASRGTRLESPFELPKEWSEFAVRERPGIDPEIEGQKFADYWLGVPGRKAFKLDWFATWRNYVRSEMYGKGKHRRNGTASDGFKSLDEKAAEIQILLERQGLA